MTILELFKSTILMSMVLVLGFYGRDFWVAHNQRRPWHKLILAAHALLYSVFLIWLAYQVERCSFGNFAEALFFTGWLLLLHIVWHDLNSDGRNMSFLLFLPCCVITLLGLGLLGQNSITEELKGSILFPLHVFFSLLAYALFIIGYMILLFFRKSLNDLKNKRQGFLYKRLPALSVLDRSYTMFSFYAMIMLAFGLVFGYIWIHQQGPINSYITFKIIASLLLYIIMVVNIVTKWKLSLSMNRQLIFHTLGMLILLLGLVDGGHSN